MANYNNVDLFELIGKDELIGSTLYIKEKDAQGIEVEVPKVVEDWSSDFATNQITLKYQGLTDKDTFMLREKFKVTTKANSTFTEIKRKGKVKKNKKS